MLKVTLLLGLALTATAMPADVGVQDQSVRIGSAGVSYVNLKGMLTPVEDAGANIRTFWFKTEEAAPEEEMVTFTCMPLPDVYVSVEGSEKEALFCHGYVPVVDDKEDKKVVFLFAAQGFDLSPEDNEVKLVLGRSVVTGLTSTSDTLLGTTVLGDRVKRQWGSGFSGSGAQAGATSFGGGSGVGGFPGAGFGGGFSGSSAQAGASSFGTGVGRFPG